MLGRIAIVAAGALAVVLGLDKLAQRGAQPDVPDEIDDLQEGDGADSDDTVPDDDLGDPEADVAAQIEEVEGRIRSELEALRDRLPDDSDVADRIEALVEAQREANTETLARLKRIEERVGREAAPEPAGEGSDDPEDDDSEPTQEEP